MVAPLPSPIRQPTAEAPRASAAPMHRVRPCRPPSMLSLFLLLLLPLVLCILCTAPVSVSGASLPLLNSSTPLLGAIHPQPSGTLPPALPSYCPIGAASLPRTLLLNPCALELSARLATASRSLSSSAGLMSAADLLLSRVPEAKLYFTFRSPHLDPRKWSASLAHVWHQAESVFLARSFPSVVNKTETAPGLDARFFFADVSQSLSLEEQSSNEVESIDSKAGLSLLPVVSISEDAVALGDLAGQVRSLAMGWFLLGNSTHAHRAAHLLHTWFVNPLTSMRPSGEYADWTDPSNAAHVGEDALLKLLPLVDLLDSVALLRSSEFLTPELVEALRAWFRSYLSWLTTSPLALGISKREDYRSIYYLVHVVSVAAFVNKPFVARAALDAGLARMETQVRRHGTIPLAMTQPTAEGIWNYQVHTLNAFAMLALQAQFLTDTAMLQTAAAAEESSAASSSAQMSRVSQSSKSKSKASTSRAGASPADIAAAAAASAAAAAIAAVSGLNPNSARFLALPDVLQYNFDGSVARSDSLFGTLANLLHDSQLQLRMWTDGASSSKGPVYVNLGLPYECFATLADLLAPLRIDATDWMSLGGFARVRSPAEVLLPGDEQDSTEVASFFTTVGLFDRGALPFFMTFGFIGLLRWSSFLVRFLPALCFLYTEKRRRKHHRSLTYTGERDVTIIVPTIDSGPELKVAINSWLRNRPKRIIFATIHTETENIQRLLQETCDEFAAAQLKQRSDLAAMRGDTPDPSECGIFPSLDGGGDDQDPESRPGSGCGSRSEADPESQFITQVDVISVSRPNKRQQMVAGMAHVDTDIFVLADDDAIWPDTCLQLLLACFDDPRIGGVGTEQRMRPMGRKGDGGSWFRIGGATIWEVIADFRLTAKLIDNAASVWFGTSVSCLSGRTAAYRTCIVKPSVHTGPCNPHANRFFHVDEHGFRKEDYTPPQALSLQLLSKLHRVEVFEDSLDAEDLRQLVSHKNKLRSIDTSRASTTRRASDSSVLAHDSRMSTLSSTGQPAGPPVAATVGGGRSTDVSKSASTSTPQPSEHKSPEPTSTATATATATAAATGAVGTGTGGAAATEGMHRRHSPRRVEEAALPSSPPVSEIDVVSPLPPAAGHLRHVSSQGSMNSLCSNSSCCSNGSRGSSGSVCATLHEDDASLAPSKEQQQQQLPVDDFDTVISAVSGRRHVRKLPPASTVQSSTLPLLFFSFCIDFCNDYFIQPWDAAQLHSGDDKFLTRYITNRGWLMYTQTGESATVESTFKPNWRFLIQYMRWTRNTWRSDFRSLVKERAVWKSPHYWFLVFLMVDKMISPFTLLFGPILVTNLALHASLGIAATPDDADRPYRLPLWNIIISYAVWICVTRAFRIFPHFLRQPKHIVAIPFYVAMQYFLAVLKIYCLFTLHVTDWGTRDTESDASNHGTGKQAPVAQVAKPLQAQRATGPTAVLARPLSHTPKAAPPLPTSPKSPAHMV